MENSVYKYSDFIVDDGGLERAKKDLEKTSKDIISIAKKTKTEFDKALKSGSNETVNAFEKKTTLLTEALRKQKTAEESLLVTEKKLQAAKKKNTEATKKQTQETANLREQRRKSNAQARQTAKIVNTQTGSIENLRAKLALVTTAWARLSSVELENTKRGRRLVQSKKNVTAELRRLEAATGDNRRNVGNYSSALGKLRGSLTSVASAAGVTLGVFGAFRLIKSSITLVRDFEKANATLSGILSATDAEMIALTSSSKELGATTVKTASEVVSLQTEYARLGFGVSDIINLTEATINGSIALNSNLGETSKLVGAVVNSFDDLSTTDVEGIIETLVGSTTKSALSFERLQTSLPIVAGAANAVGLTLEDTVAILAKLSDSGIDASSSATALRNVLIESADRGQDYKKGLEEIRNSTDKLKKANELFGKKAAVSALILANNTDAVSALAKELEDIVVVQQLVDKELNTLDGSLKLLNSAWEGLVLSLNDASGSGNALSSTIKFLAENLQTIIKTIAISTSAWITYNIVQRASIALSKSNIVFTKVLTIVQNLNTIATNAATAAQTAFNTAAKANIIGLLAALLVSAVAAYYAFRDSATAAMKAQQAFNDATAEGLDIGAKASLARRKAIQEEIDSFNRLAEERKASGENQEKVNNETLSRQDRFINGFEKLSQEEIDILKNQLDSEKDINSERVKELKKLEAESDIFGRNDQREQELKNDIDFSNKEQGVLTGRINSANIFLIELQKIREKGLRDLKLSNLKINAENEADAKKRAKYLADLRRRLQDLEDQAIDEAELREKQISKRKFNREIEEIRSRREKLSAVEIALIKQLEETRDAEIQDTIDKFSKLRQDKRLAQGSKEIEDEKTIAIAKINQRRGEFDNEEDFVKARDSALIKIEIDALQKRLDLLLLFGDEFKAEREKLRGEIELLNNTQIIDTDQFAEQAKEIRDILTLTGKEVSKFYAQSAKDAQDSLSKQQDAVDEQRSRAEQGLTNTLAFEQKELAKRESEVLKRQKRQERIEKLQSYWNTYNANINSLKEGQDSSVAINKTIKDISIIEAITASLKSFGDGGVVEDRLPGNGIFKGDSHNSKSGGIPIMVEGKEGIFSTKEMGNLGKDNFYALKQMANDGVIGKDIFTSQRQGFDKAVAVPVQTGNGKLLAQMKSVEAAIKNKPVSSMEVSKLANGMIDVIEKTKQGKRITRNHHIIKPRL